MRLVSEIKWNQTIKQVLISVPKQDMLFVIQVKCVGRGLLHCAAPKSLKLFFQRLLNTFKRFPLQFEQACLICPPTDSVPRFRETSPNHSRGFSRWWRGSQSAALLAWTADKKDTRSPSTALHQIKNYILLVALPVGCTWQKKTIVFNTFCTVLLPKNKYGPQSLARWSNNGRLVRQHPGVTHLPWNLPV